jgi:hypothetical protein
MDILVIYFLGGWCSDVFWPMSLETFYFAALFRSVLCIKWVSYSLFLFKRCLQGIPGDHFNKQHQQWNICSLFFSKVSEQSVFGGRE